MARHSAANQETYSTFSQFIISSDGVWGSRFGAIDVRERPLNGQNWKHLDSLIKTLSRKCYVLNVLYFFLLSSSSEADFITQVVDKILPKLDLKQLSIPTHIIGMETRVKAIDSWLKNEQYNAIAICGMGGSGKTTLAKHIYNLYKEDFDSSSFVENIGIEYKEHLLELQKQLLKDVLGGKKISIHGVSEGTHKIEEVLQMKNVLIVLDDINDPDQLSTLLGKKAFLSQSKIIITTSLLDIDAWFRSISWRCRVHKLELLNDLESLELLSLHAFGSKIPMEGFKDLAERLAQYCEGNPLALKVLGSSIFLSDEDSHKRNSMIDIWIDRINSFTSSKGDHDRKIQDVMRKSFDCLQLDSYKELFLDIACFFVGEIKDMVTIWGDDMHARSGITALINRCLLTISHDTGKLMMPRLLQDMGRKIVYEESKQPAERSRVCHDDESYRILKKGNGTDKIEGLALNMLEVKQVTSSQAALKTSSIAMMDNLKLLKLKYVRFTGSYNNFPALRFLWWHGCHLETMPSGLLMSSLMALDMRFGHMETFEVPMGLNSLKILNLDGCYKLARIRNLYQLPKLETLKLRNCSRLIHLSNSIRYLESLANLYLTCCTKLWKASSRNEIQPLLSLPQSLRVLDLSCCDLEYNNDVHVVFRAQSLFKLTLSNNPFKYLPKRIELKMLRKLSLLSCHNLKSLPCMPRTLVKLNVDGCKSLESITFQSGRFSLKEFSYEGCSNLSEVQGLFKIVPLAKVDKVDLIQQWHWIKEYEYDEVDLVSYKVTKEIDGKIQMLYEYGITSTFLQGTMDQIMISYEYTSSSSDLSFWVPYLHEKYRIQGLNVSCLFRSLGVDNKRCVFVKISNRTKGLTWVYNPVVYCKPRVDEDVMWLSYWPIGKILDAGDEVSVNIYVDHGMTVSECSASFLYMDGEIENEESTITVQEVIGGDLSEFEVTPGAYYLCRCDIFGSMTSSWLTWVFGDNIDYPESHGWRKTLQRPIGSYKPDFSKKIVLRVRLNSERENKKMLEVVGSISGVESVSSGKGILIVAGRPEHLDPVEVIERIKKIGIMAEVRLTA
ncbi:disease resistance protein RUN1-like [Helianthus annuus]|uniref:disease resistance protein RUN1-like n=1 Tax=Helianthus annuus TaxID=4232 RepID=UPI000B902D62|nr:disease resistance protein RUN1-like [Helianthus annuus]